MKPAYCIKLSYHPPVISFVEPRQFFYVVLKEAEESDHGVADDCREEGRQGKVVREDGLVIKVCESYPVQRSQCPHSQYSHQHIAYVAVHPGLLGGWDG